MKHEKIASVHIVFTREPGAGNVNVADVIAWMQAMLAGPDPVEGCNGLRYSRGHVVAATVEFET